MENLVTLTRYNHANEGRKAIGTIQVSPEKAKQILNDPIQSKIHKEGNHVTGETPKNGRIVTTEELTAFNETLKAATEAEEKAKVELEAVRKGFLEDYEKLKSEKEALSVELEAANKEIETLKAATEELKAAVAQAESKAEKTTKKQLNGEGSESK